jgi:outer membrane receptor for ferrienterochelin and colicin
MNLSSAKNRAGIGRVRCPKVESTSLVLWILLATLEGALGQSQDVMSLSLEELRTVQVYTASMYLQSDREAPSSVTMITAGQIRQFGYRTLADILRSVRGFEVTYDRVLRLCRRARLLSNRRI